MDIENSKWIESGKAPHSAGVVIRIDLLQSIRDLLDTAGDEYKECRDFCDKLDSLYPFLNQPK